MFTEADFKAVRHGRSKKKQEYLEHLLTYKAGDILKTSSRNALVHGFNWDSTPFQYYDKRFGYKTLGEKYTNYEWSYLYYHNRTFKQEHIDFLKGYYDYAFVPKDEKINEDY